MAKITFIENNGTEYCIDAPVGSTVMEAAVRQGIPGIDADCGGACSCATCHVYIDPAWQDVVGGPNEVEQDLLELAEEVAPNSRLSCQITVGDALDGLVIRLLQ